MAQSEAAQRPAERGVGIVLFLIATTLTERFQIRSDSWLRAS